MFTRTDLKLDLDTHLVAGMRADWIRRTTIGGQIPIFVLVCDFTLFEHDSPGWPQYGFWSRGVLQEPR